MSKGYKIADACKELDVQPYVLRYWETEFPFLRPEKGSSGPRVYSERELGLIRRIKELLYDEGYTIAGAKKKLEGELESGKTASGKPASAKAAPAKDEASSGDGAGAPPKRARSKRTEGQQSLAEIDEEEATAPVSSAATTGAEPGADAIEPPAAAEVPSLDSSSNERIETIARGLRALRDEARELLDLLQGGASSASDRKGAASGDTP